MPQLAINGGPAIAEELKIPPWPQHNETDRQALQEVLEGGRWFRSYPGSWAQRFEEAWADYHDARHCIVTANGTVSLQLALRAGGVHAGDEVIVPAVTFIATASAVTEIGAIPIFADIDRETGCIAAESVAERITDRTRAVIGVHYAGYPFDFDRLLRLCHKHELPLIEDAAHAHGTEWKGRKVGAIGTIGSFSFQESKSLPSGEGGAVVTDDDELFQQAILAHNIGRVVGEPGYAHFILSSNYRLSEFQAALLLSQLQRLPEWTERKAANGRWLAERVQEIGGLEPLRTDERITGRGYYFFVLRYNSEEFGGVDRDRFLAALHAEGVPGGVAYGVPLYHNPAFEPERLRQAVGPLVEQMPDYQSLNLPNAEQFCRQQVTFMHQVLLAHRDDLELIVAAIAKIKRHADELRE